jgi:hypothetical protein
MYDSEKVQNEKKYHQFINVPSAHKKHVTGETYLLPAPRPGATILGTFLPQLSFFGQG